MKCIVIFLAVCLACAYGADHSDKLQDEECIKESGVDIEKLKEMAKSNTIVIDRKAGCYSACVMKKNGIMSADGVINPQAEKFPKSEGWKKCSNLTGVDACDTAARVIECALKADLETKKADEIEE